LIELFVGKTLLSQSDPIERMSLQLLRALWRVSTEIVGHRVTYLTNLGDKLLDTSVFVELLGLLLEDQVCPDAPARERLDVVQIGRSVGVCVEVARSLVSHIRQELDEEERLLAGMAAEAEILVVASTILIVQVKVEQLPRVPRLRD